jgi:hypothetical protein
MHTRIPEFKVKYMMEYERYRKINSTIIIELNVE